MRGLIPSAEPHGRPPVTLAPSLTITNIDIPFGRMVELVLMWSLASVVAGIALAVILGVPFLILRAFIA